MNLSGVLLSTSGGNSEDDIAEFTNSNGAFTGIIDTNDQGTTSFRNAFSANYSADTTAAGRATVSHTRNAPLMTTYVVDSSTAVAVSADSAFVGLGAFVKQNSSAKSNIVANHLAVLRITPSARARSSASKPQPTRSK